MATVLNIIQIVNAFVLVATLVAVIFYTVKTSQMAAATRDMAKASEKQRYDQLRPLLVPNGKPAFRENGGHPSRLSTSDIDEQGYSSQQLSIRNMGVGPALNIVSTLGASESYAIDNSGTPERKEVNLHWMGRLERPLAPGEEAKCDCIMGRDRPPNKGASTLSLSAPPEPTLEQITKEHMPVHAARVTITYQDVFGRKHHSVFDYVQHWRGKPDVYEDLKIHGGWELMEFAPGIEQDLQDLAGMSE